LKLIAEGLRDDTTPVFLTSEETIKTRCLQSKEVKEADVTSEDSSFWSENTRAIRVAPGASTLENIPLPPRSSARQAELRALAR
jgi:hypothetical protein